MLGLIPEPPFHPRSWSGSSAPFFSALKVDAREVRAAQWPQKLKALAIPVSRWRARYHASVPRFEALTRAAGRVISTHRPNSVLQIGAWFSSGAVADVPCHSYHDGNAAQWYRHYGRGLLSERERQRHLDWERSVYERMTRIFVMSEWLAKSFVDDFGIPRERLCVVGAGINMPFPPAVKRDFSKARFLFVGRDFERKGGRYLLDAFARVRREIDAELIIAGPEPREAVEGVRWVGFLSKAALAPLFAQATCMILPSIYEPFGISLCEGMAWGLPCVTVDRCAMPEIVGGCGVVACAEDASDLARAMLEIASDPEKSSAYGAAARARCAREFTWDAVAQKIAAHCADPPCRPARPTS